MNSELIIILYIIGVIITFVGAAYYDGRQYERFATPLELFVFALLWPIIICAGLNIILIFTFLNISDYIYQRIVQKK